MAEAAKSFYLLGLEYAPLVLLYQQLSVLNDAGEVVRSAYVHADADIYARTFYQYQSEFPQYHMVKVKTGKKRRGLGVAAGSFRMRILTPDFEKNTWEFVTDTTQLHLFEDFYLPVYIERITGEALVSYERPYTAAEKEEMALKVQEEYLKNLMEKGVQIIENNVKIQEYGVSWKVEGTVAGEEQIGVRRYITEFEETSRIDEHN